VNELFATTSAGRRLACRPVAVLVFIVDADERVLLMESPRYPGIWQVVNGAVEANETLLQAVLRETSEEAGPNVSIRPLGVAHAFSFPYDNDIPTMLSVCYVASYEGGDVVPGDDMAGSEFGWFAREEMADKPLLPRHPWLFDRAIELHRLWRNTAPRELEPDV
jgi:ADP-ribose pyrophosphatase YjhB (NUDIX family)